MTVTEERTLRYSSHVARTMAANAEQVKKQASSAYPDNGYAMRHAEAWTAPQFAERPIVGMVKAWLEYADSAQARYESPIGDDYVLGDEWAAIGFALRGLLNGELGRLDGGSMDRTISDALDAEGFDIDTQRRNKS